MKENTEKLLKLKIDETATEANEDDCLKWGLPLPEIFKLSMKFYKGILEKMFSRKNFVTFAFLLQTNRVKLFISRMKRT